MAVVSRRPVYESGPREHAAPIELDTERAAACTTPEHKAPLSPSDGARENHLRVW
jgi:hypothetical protein